MARKGERIEEAERVRKALALQAERGTCGARSLKVASCLRPDEMEPATWAYRRTP